MLASTRWTAGLLTYFLLSQISPTWESFSGRCVGVTDGDTISSDPVLAQAEETARFAEIGIW